MRKAKMIEQAYKMRIKELSKKMSVHKAAAIAGVERLAKRVK